MEIENLLATLQARAPWRTVASPLLKKLGFKVSRGFEDTFDEIRGSRVTAAQAASLRHAIVEHLIAGEKLLRIYDADQPTRQALLDWGNSLTATQNRLGSSFLRPASDTLLAQHENSPPQFVALHETGSGLAIIFTASRSYLERVDLPPSSLAPGVDASSFERVYGVTKTRVQTYDVVWIPYAEDYFCIVTDSPDMAPVDFGSASQVALQAAIVRVLARRPTIRNLWPAIDGLYQATGGQFVELGFLTDTDSVKLHKSRRGRKCLRSDEYHIGGATVVGSDLQPYRVAVRWTLKAQSSEIRSYPELQLPGTARMIFGANPELDHAFIRHCLNVRHLNFVLSKVDSHL